jgi:hypothetical protein
MRLVVASVDYAPEELHAQTPFTVRLIRQLPGNDRPDYWLGELERPLVWLHNNVEKAITHLVVAARWQGTQIGPGFENLPIGLAYVTDATQLDSPVVDFTKCKYIAIGIATVAKAGDAPPPPLGSMAGYIAPGFDTGKP